jgi:hypothetical protein
MSLELTPEERQAVLRAIRAWLFRYSLMITSDGAKEFTSITYLKDAKSLLAVIEKTLNDQKTIA